MAAIRSKLAHYNLRSNKDQPLSNHERTMLDLEFKERRMINRCNQHIMEVRGQLQRLYEEIDRMEENKQKVFRRIASRQHTTSKTHRVQEPNQNKETESTCRKNAAALARQLQLSPRKKTPPKKTPDINSLSYKRARTDINIKSFANLKQKYNKSINPNEDEEMKIYTSMARMGLFSDTNGNVFERLPLVADLQRSKSDLVQYMNKQSISPVFRRHKTANDVFKRTSHHKNSEALPYIGGHQKDPLVTSTPALHVESRSDTEDDLTRTTSTGSVGNYPYSFDKSDTWEDEYDESERLEEDDDITSLPGDLPANEPWRQARKCRYLRGHEPKEMKLPKTLEKFVEFVFDSKTSATNQ